MLAPPSRRSSQCRNYVHRRFYPRLVATQPRTLLSASSHPLPTPLFVQRGTVTSATATMRRVEGSEQEMGILSIGDFAECALIRAVCPNLSRESGCPHRVRYWRIAARWVHFWSSHSPLRIWLKPQDGGLLTVALSQSNVLTALEGSGSLTSDPLPASACGARSVTDFPTLHRLVHRAFQLSRALPDDLLRTFQSKTAALPREWLPTGQ